MKQQSKNDVLEVASPEVYVLFDCRVSENKGKVGEWLPRYDGFEFQTTVLSLDDGKLYIPVFANRHDIPAYLKAGRWIAKRKISQVINEAKRINAVIKPRQAA